MNSLSKWNPFGSREDWDLSWSPFRDMQKRLEQLLGRWPERESLAVARWAPLVDITEDDKEYLVKAEIPEVKKEDIKVSVENGVLTITGERKSEKEEKNKKIHRIERSYGRFERSFTLPEGTDPAKVSSEFKDGILSVHLPKAPTAKPKPTEIPVK